MIYKSESGINILQFGTGDICVVCIGQPDAKSIDSVGFIQTDPVEVGQYRPEYDGVNEDTAKTHTKLLFTDPKSVDVVIEHLEMVKKSLLEKEPKS